MKPWNRNFDIDTYGNRKAVCRRCKYAINDVEPCSPSGEFYHPTFDKDMNRIKCPNAGKRFSVKDWEIEPFVRKRVRRLEKRLKRLFKKRK